MRQPPKYGDANPNRIATLIIALTGNVIAGAPRALFGCGNGRLLGKAFTLDQMKAMLTVRFSPPTLPTRDHLALVPASLSPEPVDYKVFDLSGSCRKSKRSDIVQQIIKLFFKGAASLLKDLERGAATTTPAASSGQPRAEVGQ
jgi:hypothetical protein